MSNALNELSNWVKIVSKAYFLFSVPSDLLFIYVCLKVKNSLLAPSSFSWIMKANAQYIIDPTLSHISLLLAMQAAWQPTTNRPLQPKHIGEAASNTCIRV